MKEKLIKILDELDKKIVERQDENRMALLGLLSSEHTLILGSPGTAKSLMARTLCQLIEGGNYFEYLLTQFTTLMKYLVLFLFKALMKIDMNELQINFCQKPILVF